MAVCDTCGNEYDKTFTLTRGQESGTFDSFECAETFACRQGFCEGHVSPRRMDSLLQTLGITGLSRSQVSVMAKELDE